MPIASSGCSPLRSSQNPKPETRNPELESGTRNNEPENPEPRNRRPENLKSRNRKRTWHLGSLNPAPYRSIPLITNNHQAKITIGP
jgi:hypothetical protein